MQKIAILTRFALMTSGTLWPVCCEEPDYNSRQGAVALPPCAVNFTQETIAVLS